MTVRAEDYSILVGLDPTSNDYVAIVREFPGLSWVSPTKQTAISGMLPLLTEVLADLTAEGIPIPAPASPRLAPA
ncbi:hypothetical protein [Agromyces aerolatus]|uniref:hypothetical protein n=1 Tax=Agromyces sp. LY-1074 TaxID=3074080 RepID=UPI002861ADB6|nr:MULTISPECIES: hypothetical protein [unclassified Agromyces]MDR5700296.1 hypothetical protein [Agromyces sp. LY-1074]MDR5706726.1 hypothetical protein [Agromyces sp. LY-1358]